MRTPGKPADVSVKPAGRFQPVRGVGSAPVPALAVTANDETNPLRNIAFRMGVALVFLNFSELHQLLTYVTHVNLYLLYLFGIPTLLGVALAGGIRKTLGGRPAIYWCLFAAWMVVGAPMSTWKGGSVSALIPYFRTVFPLLFVVAGLTLTWKECRSMMLAIAAGGVVIMTAAKMFQDTGDRYGDRLALEFGTISDANDYAVHLIFILPFVIWVGLTAKFKPLRAAAWAATCFALLLILRTASRGALVALAVGVVYWIIRGTMGQRLVLLAAGPVAAIALIAFVPKSSLVRIVSFSSDESNASQEALESSQLRKYLLEQSIIYTFEHPVFGVGLAQFSAFEGENTKSLGTHGYWHNTHNSYTQVSSECGLPALGFYVAAVLSTFLLLNRTYRKACTRPEYREIRYATFCLMLSLVGYCAGSTFVNFAYFMYLPVLTGLAIAVARGAQVEFDRPLDDAAGSALEARAAWAPRKLAASVARSV